MSGFGDFVESLGGIFGKKETVKDAPIVTSTPIPEGEGSLNTNPEIKIIPSTSAPAETPGAPTTTAPTTEAAPTITLPATPAETSAPASTTTDSSTQS